MNSIPENALEHDISRRHFLSVGLTTVSMVSAGLTVMNSPSFSSAATDDVPSINPGFVATRYYGKEEKESLIDVVDAGAPFRYYGEHDPVKVNRFEERFASYMGSRFALGVTSGTTALNSAITALGIGPGDEVIVPAYTWWSDYTCVVRACALPVFAEIDDSLCLDPEDFARKITPRTKAVIAVHLLGGPCDMNPILEIAREKGIAVLEDCAQCVGGSYKGKRLGTLGDVGIYSFQLNKMISSGEGGAVVTNEPLAYERACRFNDMGNLRDLFKDRMGGSQLGNFAGENYRMSEFTGAVLLAQLPKLNTMIHDLRHNAHIVREGIKDLPGIQLRKRPDPDGDTGYSIYFKLKNKEAKDQCIKELRKRKIPAGSLSGSVLLPVHPAVMNKETRHPNWPSFNTPEGKAIQYGPESCPQTLEVYDRFVQIRMGPKYTESENERIVAAIREVYPGVS